MVLTIKHRLKTYRKYQLDIWGLVVSSVHLYRSRLTEFFYKVVASKNPERQTFKKKYIYRVDLVDPQPYVKKIKKTFKSIRLLKFYYLTLTYAQYRHLAVRAVKLDGLYEENYCALLEGRLITMVYRANFARSMFQAIAMVKSGNIVVNSSVQTYVNYNIRLGDYIKIPVENHEKMSKLLRRRFLEGQFISNGARYLFVNLKLFYFQWILPITQKDLLFTTQIDIHRADHHE